MLHFGPYSQSICSYSRTKKKIVLIKLLLHAGTNVISRLSSCYRLREDSKGAPAKMAPA
jgi:hypothetical protein